jgi:hypothetical protein
VHKLLMDNSARLMCCGRACYSAALSDMLCCQACRCSPASICTLPKYMCKPCELCVADGGAPAAPAGRKLVRRDCRSCGSHVSGWGMMHQHLLNPAVQVLCCEQRQCQRMFAKQNACRDGAGCVLFTLGTVEGLCGSPGQMAQDFAPQVSPKRRRGLSRCLFAQRAVDGRCFLCSALSLYPSCGLAALPAQEHNRRLDRKKCNPGLAGCVKSQGHSSLNLMAPLACDLCVCVGTCSTLGQSLLLAKASSWLALRSQLKVS